MPVPFLAGGAYLLGKKQAKSRDERNAERLAEMKPDSPEWRDYLQGERALPEHEGGIAFGDAISADQRGLSRIRDIALSDDIESASPWMKFEMEKQAIEEQRAGERMGRQAMSGAAQARGQLAMRGGLRSGARERIARSLGRGLTLGRQEIGREGRASRSDIRQRGAESQRQMLMNLPGMEEAAAEALRQERGQRMEHLRGERAFEQEQKRYDLETRLKEEEAKRQFELEKYKEEQAAYAAERSAQATEKACFVENTPVRLEGGAYKSIQNLEIGDVLWGGSQVEATMTLRFPWSDDIYAYGDILVSSEHAVWEDHKWIRVRDSKGAHKTDLRPSVVYNLITSDHRIVAGETIFSDYKELAEDVSEEQFLREMNIRDAQL